MDAQKVVTTKDLVEQSIPLLAGIVLTPDEVRRIGIPVAQVLENLRLCMDAWIRDELANQEKEEADSHAETDAE